MSEEKEEHKVKKNLKKVWHFLWEEESLASYIIFILIAFLVLRFIAFPGFLYFSGYSDVAAVVSPSMVHNDLTNHTFYGWLAFNKISSEGWPFMNGLNVGDVIFVKKVPAEEIKVGDIVLFYSTQGQIIHRVVEIKNEGGAYYYTTKGDANTVSMDLEKNLTYDMIKGKLMTKVPYFGYPKVALTYIWRG